MKDRLGQEIEIGDTVVVAARQGSSSWLDVRVVDSIWSEDFPSVRTGTVLKLTKPRFVDARGRLYTFGGDEKQICVISKKDKGNNEHAQ